jgi:hypothetical protein
LYYGNTSWNVGATGISLGANAGLLSQGNAAVAVGSSAGSQQQGDNSVAMGSGAGYLEQGVNSVAIGSGAGNSNQGYNSVAVGIRSANTNQSPFSVAIGRNAGSFYQGGTIGLSVAIGTAAGYYSQGSKSVAIGASAGYTGQGNNSIAIGANAGFTGQASNSIILNASGNIVTPGTSGFFVNPVRNTTSSGATGLLVYNTLTSEIFYNTNKTFVIQHPTKNNKYLVHGCLEGPENGIYYRGKASITNDSDVTIELPEYVNKIGFDFTIHLTKIYSGKESFGKNYETSEISNGKFTVYGDNGSFYWLVHASRQTLEIEPNKEDYELLGNGPYTYLIPKKE